MAAMYAFQVGIIALAVFSLCADAKFFGGASSFKLFATDIVNGFNAKYTTDIPPYDIVGSAAGVAGFLSGVYTIGASDAPLSAAEDTKANNLGTTKKGKFTIPLALSTFTFATKKASNVKLSAAQVISIYKGQLTSWGAIAAGSTGTIVPVARLDGSGSTNVINTFLKVAGWKLVGDASWNGKAGISSSVVYQTGSGGVVNYLKGNSDAIGYVVTGLAISGGLSQSAIKNPAGNYLQAVNADPIQSIPRPLPKSAASWSGVVLVNKAGAATYPIVSFEYTFVKIQGGYLAKKFLEYTQTSEVQNLLNTKYDNQFFRLPASVTVQNVAAIKSIV